MHEVMEGRAAPGALAGLLTALAMKGERPHEIVGFARTMREHAVKLSAPAGEVFDTCGTGGDRAGTFNVSSTAAVVLPRPASPWPSTATGRCRASAAAPTCSRRWASTSRRRRPWSSAACARRASRSSSRPPSIRRCGTPAPTRRELGLRTAFNLLGPLTNPARASRQIVGVPRPELTELLARALMMLGSTRAWVVHGADGLDEISTTGYTKVSECRDGAVHTFYVHPADFGLAKAAPAALKGGDAATNAAIIRVGARRHGRGRRATSCC